MPGVSHVLFIDETGWGQADRHGVTTKRVHRPWVSVTVGVEWGLD